MLDGDRGSVKTFNEHIKHICTRNQFISRLRKHPVYFERGISPVATYMIDELAAMGYAIEHEAIVITRQGKTIQKKERFVLISEPNKESLQ